MFFFCFGLNSETCVSLFLKHIWCHCLVQFLGGVVKNVSRGFDVGGGFDGTTSGSTIGFALD